MALHIFWFMLLMPPVVWAVRRWPALRLRRVGLALIWLGVIANAAVVGRVLFTSLGGPFRDLVPSRIFFILLKQWQVPVFQLPVAGLVCWLASHFRKQVPPLVHQAEPTSTE